MRIKLSATFLLVLFSSSAMSSDVLYQKSDSPYGNEMFNFIFKKLGSPNILTPSLTCNSKCDTGEGAYRKIENCQEECQGPIENEVPYKTETFYKNVHYKSKDGITTRGRELVKGYPSLMQGQDWTNKSVVAHLNSCNFNRPLEIVKRETMNCIDSGPSELRGRRVSGKWIGCNPRVPTCTDSQDILKRAKRELLSRLVNQIKCKDVSRLSEADLNKSFKSHMRKLERPSCNLPLFLPDDVKEILKNDQVEIDKLISDALGIKVLTGNHANSFEVEEIVIDLEDRTIDQGIEYYQRRIAPRQSVVDDMGANYYIGLDEKGQCHAYEGRGLKTKSHFIANSQDAGKVTIALADSSRRNGESAAIISARCARTLSQLTKSIKQQVPTIKTVRTKTQVLLEDTGCNISIDDRDLENEDLLIQLSDALK